MDQPLTDDPVPLSDSQVLLSAADHGRICATAAAGQRDLMARAAAYPDLFPRRPFDPAVFGTISLATAFGAPWYAAEQLRVANRAALWVFAVDWLIDHQAREQTEVDAIVDRCLAVADELSPATDDQLGRFLAEIVTDLATAPAFSERHHLWRAELDRMLAAMAREWRWKTARASSAGRVTPTFDEYLANADNFGSSFVNLSHWLRIGDGGCMANLTELTTASRAVQRVLRLVNDLATHRRDLLWGDLNAMMLTTDRDVVDKQVALLVEHCRQLLRPLETRCPAEAAYLSRQIGFSTGFYQVTDFWGSL